MVSIHGYNAERKDKKHSDLYIMAGAFGVFCALVLIFGGIGLGWLVGFIIDRWLWVLGVLLAVLIIKKYMWRPRT